MTNDQRKVAYVVVSNAARRAHIIEELRSRGLLVVEQPTGCHVLGALAEVFEGKTDELPAKIVIDARARGCTGTSIASGLAELGVNVPVELVDESVQAA